MPCVICHAKFKCRIPSVMMTNLIQMPCVILLFITIPLSLSLSRHPLGIIISAYHLISCRSPSVMPAYHLISCRAPSIMPACLPPSLTHSFKFMRSTYGKTKQQNAKQNSNYKTYSKQMKKKKIYIYKTKCKTNCKQIANTIIHI